MHKPSALQKGDTIAILSTARKFVLEEVQTSISILESWGFQVKLFPSIYAVDHQFAGTDAERAANFQRAIDDTEVKAILCARGGYGTARMIDLVDFGSFSSRPIWVIGFSDVTTAHMHLQHMGYQSLHATMPLFFEKEGNQKALESMRKCLVGEQESVVWNHHPLDHLGRTKGELIGGNLSVIHSVIDTPSEPSWEGRILFIEDLDEYLYHMDRMLNHLDRTGRIGKLSGMIVGHMSHMHDNKIPFGEDVYTIIHRITKKYSIPVGFGFPAGHEPDNRALIMGSTIELIVQPEGNEMAYSEA